MKNYVTPLSALLLAINLGLGILIGKTFFSTYEYREVRKSTFKLDFNTPFYYEGNGYMLKKIDNTGGYGSLKRLDLTFEFDEKLLDNK